MPRRILSSPIDELRHLISPARMGRDRIISILRFLAVHRTASLYAVAKYVYGDGIRYNRNVRRQICCLQKVKGLIEVKRGARKVSISLTESGKLLCQQLGVITPTSRSEAVLSALNAILPEPLSDAQIVQGLRLLDDRLVDAIAEIVTRVSLCLGCAESTKNADLMKIDPITLLIVLTIYDKEKMTVQRGIVTQVLDDYDARETFDKFVEWVKVLIRFSPISNYISKWAPAIFRGIERGKRLDEGISTYKITQTDTKSFAPCGLNCFACIGLQIGCPGCRDDALRDFPCAVRKCCLVVKGLNSCADCSEFPCDKYEFWSRPTERIHALWTIEKIREVGWDQWLRNYPDIFFSVLRSKAENGDVYIAAGVPFAFQHIIFKYPREVLNVLGEWGRSENERLRNVASKTLIRLSNRKEVLQRLSLVVKR